MPGLYLFGIVELVANSDAVMGNEVLRFTCNHSSTQIDFGLQSEWTELLYSPPVILRRSKSHCLDLLGTTSLSSSLHFFNVVRQNSTKLFLNMNWKRALI